MQPNIPGPCGTIPDTPPPVFRNDLMIRLHEDAVTKDGYHPGVLKIFQWLQTAGGSIETMRSASMFAGGSISTGASNWQVNGVPAVMLTNRPVAWITPTGDGAWVGSKANDGQSAAAGSYVYSLNIGAQFGKRGFFSLVWAADNSITWSITNGSLNGTTSGSEFSFASVHGAPRSLSGIFSPSSVLTATVTNQSGPTGFLAIGTVGELPEPNGEGGLPQFETRFVLTPGTGQPAIRLATGLPGMPATPGLTFPSTPHELVRDELRNLRVRFASVPPESLINCLLTVPGVKYAERIPLSVLNVNLAVEPPPAKVPQGGGAMGAVGFKAFGPKADNLAILDGVFGKQNEPPTHGNQVHWAAVPYLPNDAKVELWTITEQDKEGVDIKFLQKSETTVNPSNYFSALRNIRLRNALGLSAIQVVNISRGGLPSGMEADEIDEMRKADILVVAAAGQNNSGRVVDFPAAYGSVLSVGGARPSGSEWVPWMNANFTFDVKEKVFSRKKMNAVNVVAPAEAVYVGNTWMNGTSFASPVVAALCAAIRAKYPNLKEWEVRDRVSRTARTLTTSEPERYGKGMIYWVEAIK